MDKVKFLALCSLVQMINHTLHH